MRRLILLTLLSIVSIYAFAQKGKLSGKIVDGETGEELIGATVLIVESGQGTITDLSGNYMLDLEPGNYTVNVSYVSYAAKKIENLEIEPGNHQEINVSMSSDIQLDEIVVEAAAIKDNDVALLKLQKQSLAVQDGISSREIQKIGASDAAESMTFVTGAAVEGGKYMVMRGLGDRYSLVQMNGITMPSADPYRNSVSMDMIPAEMIENVTTVKTFLPDKPASFTGGLVDVTTKSIPSVFYMRFNVSTTFNTVSSFRDDFLGDGATANRWLSLDNGNRKKPYIFDLYPELLKRNVVDATRAGAVLATNTEPPLPLNDTKFQVLDEAAKSGKNSFTPKPVNSYMDTGFKLAFGNQHSLAQNPIGYNIGINYRRGFDLRDNYQTGFYSVKGSSVEDSLVTDQSFNRHYTAEEVAYGGIFGLSYQLSSNNELSFNTLYNRNAVTLADTASGYWRNTGRPNYQSQKISHTERTLWNNQLTGRHNISSWKNASIEWALGYIELTQDQPDFRGFGFTTSGSRYVMNTAEIGRLPAHFYRYLKDRQMNGQIDITLPFSDHKENIIKFGGSYSKKEREFSEYIYGHHREPVTPQPGVNDDWLSFSSAAGNFASYFDQSNYGYLGTYGENAVFNRQEFGFGILQHDASVLANNYTGSEEFISGYLMGAYKLGKVKLIGGARVETTNMETVSADTTLVPTGEIDANGNSITKSRNGNLDNVDVLPSLNIIWSVNEKTNLRASVSRTLARPNMREISPFVSVGTPEDPQFVGNNGLERTLITNYDLRYEIYPKPGELIAVSAYYKKFQNPIVLQNLPQASTPEIKPINTEEANVYGVELEFRKSLGFVTQGLQNFKIGANLSLIYSKVAKDSIELAAINIEGIEDWRPLQGQSPYIANVILNYYSPKLQWDNTLTYNIFGPRLSFITEANTPDVYERSRNMLNFISSKKIGKHLNVGVKVRNILNVDFLHEFDHNKHSFIYEGYNEGTSFEISLGYSL